MRRLILVLTMFLSQYLYAQVYDPTNINMLDPNSVMKQNGNNKFAWGRDSTHTQKVDVPEGFFQWTIGERFGDITPHVADTVMFGFQKINNTDGMTGQYSFLGNLGAPRLSRIFFDRNSSGDPFQVINGYSFFRPQINTFRYWNTKSPITNLSYHSAGSGDTGADHIRASFATNINKISGVGFLIDYTYGRGYYANQGNSLFNGTLFGYYRGDKYQMHAWVSSNHMKTAENGGIEDDSYITDPKQFSHSFQSNTIPTNLNSNWNRNNDQTYFLTHRYNFGFYQDKELPDSTNVDSLMRADTLWVVPQEFVPVASIIHTFHIKSWSHINIAHREPENFYADTFYGKIGNVFDRQYNMQVRNTFGLAMREGFRKWVKAGITAFITHDLNMYTIPGRPHFPTGKHLYQNYTENNIYVGGNIARKQGETLHFDVTGQAVVIGSNIGDFDVDANVDLKFKLFRDTCAVRLHAYIKDETPNFYWRKWHSQHAWWDNNLQKEFRTRVEGIFSLGHTNTSLRVGWENITNYTYLKTTMAQVEGSEKFSRAYSVEQTPSSIQVLTAALTQNFALGVLHCDNEVVWQKSSNEKALPLPAISLYTNLYLRFKVFKIMRVDMGADMRYWTSYYAPDYAPVLNQFTVQDDKQHIKIGNHPIINAYMNVQLKRIRFYVCGNHVNGGKGKGFYAPHYPINPLSIQFGLSWNFVN